MTQTRLYLIRHADVENPQRLLYGHLDGLRQSYNLPSGSHDPHKCIGAEIREEDTEQAARP